MTDPKLIEAVARAYAKIADGAVYDAMPPESREMYAKRVMPIISAYEAARGDGVWVPREPTREMMEAVSPFPAHLAKDHPDPADPWHAMMRGATVADQLAAASIYRAMIAAAKGE